MILSDISSIKVINFIEVQCDKCPILFSRTLKNVRASRKRHNNLDLCLECANKKAANGRIQNTKEFWNNEKIKERHSQILKNSQIFQDAIKSLDRKGISNPMFNKTHSKKTKDQMSLSQIGKKQSQQTIDNRKNTFAEKREEKLKKNGYLNLNKEIRWHIHKTINWYKRIYDRDGYKCVKCGTPGKLDAHHIKSLNSLITELTINKIFETELDKYKFLIRCPEILDENLKNGITLCRKCHRKIHNWGSHKS